MIFAMRSQRLKEGSRSETFYDEVDSSFSGQDAGFNLTNGMTDRLAGMGTTSQSGTNPSVLNPVGSATSTAYNVGQGMRTDDAENLDGTTGEMRSTKWHSRSRKSPLPLSPEL